MLTYILRNFRNTVLLFSVCFALITNHVFAQTGTWTPVSTSAPHYNSGVMLLLTNGTVICKNSSGGNYTSDDAGLGTGWDRLTPVNGSYANGVWDSIASMDSPRLYFSTQVLPSGKVYACGGEYGGGGNNGEVYDPKLNVWYAAGTGTTTGTYFLPSSVSDANSEILPNGDVLQACVGCGGTTTFLWNPTTNTYSAGGSSLRYDDEAVWVKLPDNSVLFMDNFSTTSERYIPSTNSWVNDATAPENLYDPYGYEAGAAFLLPNGKVWFIGSLSNTLYYTPSGTSSPGTWAEGPSIPNAEGAPDAAASMLPNGHILLVLSPTPTSVDHFPTPTKYYEFDYTTNTFTLLSPPWGTGDSTDNATYISNMLALPDGTVLFCNQGDDQYYVYTPGSGPLAAGQPTINNVNEMNCDSFQVTGTLFNGIGEGAAYGDDWQMSTNYPIVRLTSGSNIYYATTYNWNRIGAVMTGSALDTAYFKLPAGLPAGSYSLQVIANGNPSANYTFNTIPAALTPSASAVCMGSTTSLNDATSGGTWSSANTSVATVASGVVTGVGSGTVVISYVVAGGCAATEIVSVNIPPPAITGIEYTNVGGTTMLADATGGGAWSSTNTGVATVNSATGAVTGVSVGTTTISYINSCGGTATTYKVLTGSLCIPAPTQAVTSCDYGVTFEGLILAGEAGTSINDAMGCNGSGYLDRTSLSCSLDKGSSYTVNITTGSGNTEYTQFWIDFNGDNVFQTSESVGGNTTAFAPTGSVTITIPSSVPAGTYRMRGVISFSGSGHLYPNIDPCMSGYTYGEARDYAVSILCSTTVITGTPSVCAGATTALSDATGGGSWSSSSTAVATVGSTGIVTGVAAGTTNISYSTGGCSSSVTVTVNPAPNAGTIGGASSVCVGSSITLTDAAGGGVWSSTNSASGTVSGGVVTGILAGTTIISYTVTNGCGTVAATKNVTINPLPNAGTITGTSTICVGGTSQLTDAVTGGVWGSSNTTVVTVGSAGLITGISYGSTTVTYMVTNGCGSVSTNDLIFVNPLPNAGSITGAGSVCVGSNITLTDATGGGVWSSTNSANGTVSGGVVSGIGAGTTTISYTVTNSCGTVAATKNVTINPLPNAGTITGTSTICVGATSQLTDAVTGGVWGSSNTAVVTVGSAGLITGVSYGSTSVTYVVTNGCGSVTATDIVFVNPLPNAGSITGASSVCVGSNITLTDATGGGVWSSTNSANGTVSGGIVSGIAAGTTAISYTVTNSCGTVAATHNVTINPLPNAGTITGTSTICVGATSQLTDAVSGGVWGSSNTAVVTVSSAGLITGVSYGSTSVTYVVTNGCGSITATDIAFVNAAPGAISGTTVVAVSGVTTLTDITGSGSWSSSNTSIATVDGSGDVSGVGAGTATITYMLGTGCFTTAVVTVYSSGIAPITGTFEICNSGGSTTLSDVSTGGTWSSDNTSVATVDPSSGLVTGGAAGTATIIYTLGINSTSVVMTVDATPDAGSISGPGSVCAGSSITLSDVAGGGIWSSNNTSAATVSGGVVTGIAYGSSTISYTATNSCGSVSATDLIFVNPLPDAGTITGGTTICIGSTTNLTDATTGGVWSSASTGTATVNSSGVVAGLTSGTAPISYTVTGDCGNVSAIFVVVTVNALPTITLGAMPTVCAGDTTAFLPYSATTGNPIYNITWDSTAQAHGFMSTPGIISTLIGGLNFPAGVAVDAMGNVYVADGFNQVIRKVNTAGISTIVAGNGTGGYSGDGGLATSASLNYPSSVALDATGNLYIADENNNVIRKVNAAGIISTLAGTGSMGYGGDGGLATAAQLSSPDGLAVDASGNLYIADFSNQVIREVNTSGIISTVAGDNALGAGYSGDGGLATAAQLFNPEAVAVDAAGNLYIADDLNQVIRKVNTAGIISTVAGNNALYTGYSGDGGPATSATLKYPTGVAVDAAGNLYIADENNNVIRKVNTAGIISTVAGNYALGGGYSGDGGLATAAQITAPIGLAVDPSGNLYFSEQGNNDVRKVSYYDSLGTSPITLAVPGAVATGTYHGTITAVNATCSNAYAVSVTIVAPGNAGTIVGTTVLCAGATASLSDAAVGGVWSSGATGIATVGSAGIVTGVTGGTATISYTVTSGCGSSSTTAVVTVNPLPAAGTITGTAMLCAGFTTNLTDAAAGGVWSSASTGVATVGSNGLVTGITAGTSKISYTVTNGCGSVRATNVVTVSSTSAGTVNGLSTVMVGSGITLTDAVGGGVWSSSNSNATVVGGLVTGVSAGTVIISYAVTGGCGTGYATKTITVNNSSISGINGNTAICEGATTMLTDATTGGTWSMSSLVATINGSTGVVTASNTYTGTATVTYTSGGVSTTIVLTVNANPTPIQGATTECAGASIPLSDATAGGAWTATGDGAGSGTGSSGTFVAGSVAGTATVIYTLPSGCFITIMNTVKANPSPILGATTLCVGGVTILSDATAGGTSWTSSNTAVAHASGADITGVSIGSATITYTISTGCSVTTTITVSGPPSITGNTGAICPGSTLALIAGAGTWTSGSSAIAVVGSTGVVTGISGGVAAITYSPAGSAGCTATTVVTVSATPVITGTATICPGGTTTLHDAVSGGVWTSGSTTIATVNGAGLVSGLANGTAVITYTTATGCTGMLTVTVSGVSSVISGNLFLCNGSTTTLSDASPGGTWSMGSGLATVVGSTGVVTASATLTGTTTVSYTSGGCSATAVLTVNAKPTPIQGATAECAGVTVSLTDATAGGTWSGSGDATVSGAGTGGTLVAGAVGGTATVTYTIGTGCTTTITNTIYAAPQPIMGNFNMCIGLVTLLSDASPVSSWSSSNTAIAIASGADISGEAAGTATITFKTSAAGNCITTQVVTVSAMPVVAAISGPATISHAGSPISISDATTGGVWTSSSTSVITLAGSTSNPIAATALTTTGSSVITYAVTISGCTTKVTRTFSAATAPHPDGGTTSVTAGSAVSLADDAPGGMWSSSDNGIATVDNGGLVTGLMPGNVIISHEITGDDGVLTTNVTNVAVSAAPALISILPNPNKGTFAVKGTLGSIAREQVTLEVTDLLGQVIYKTQVIAQGGKLNETITLSNTLANGMYILNVESGTAHATFHFVIEQ